MLTIELPKQDGTKGIVASKVYQVVYCLEIRYSVGEFWWQIRHLLKCPVLCIDSLTEAQRRAKEWKVQLGSKFQPLINGETDGNFEINDCDNLFGISVIRGFDAGELESPDFPLEESGYL